jgi:phosphate starvation-inducible protein PhoH
MPGRELGAWVVCEANDLLCRERPRADSGVDPGRLEDLDRLSLVDDRDRELDDALPREHGRVEVRRLVYLGRIEIIPIAVLLTRAYWR